MSTFVYRNLRTGNWSLRNTSTGLVYGHKDTVFLVRANPKVSQAGRKRVLEDRQKNVHAGILGTVIHTSSGLADHQSVIEARGYREITYNPYKYSSFVYKDTEEPVEPLEDGYAVIMNDNSVFILEY